ncbi:MULTISPECIES: MFS transporter [Paraburkholderia]|jgi:MFS family permease|uniref:Fucose permease n=1 Tax=Paraburkholderia terricola TaxID=169427 RepID=A0A1M6Y6Z4_9BURK|nr:MULTISPECIES: MFS transporter [Paraburkholderia]ORC45477.1 MFS transporter [Burkholderia sp. A27]MDR6411894.1 MFS family permease [Paraburkholderia terricola]MDR6484462.1 MFS family permease [Paraburkholderia terricola]SDP34436.1 Fucose permease [Paraburkholderia sediminicola]SHL14036.1 Fucose permease [Paraburkholderia terricola]
MTSHLASSIKPLKERIATIGVFLANGFGIGAWAVEVPRIKESLALSDTALGIALFAFALGAIVAMPLAGQLAPRFGSGRATALLGAAFVVALPLPAFAPGMAALCIVLFMLGAANGALDVSMNGHASTIETQWRSPIMSSFHAAWSAGGLLGAATGALLQKGGVGVIGGLLLPGVVIGIVIVAAALLALRDLGPRAAASSSGFAWPSGGVMKLAMLAFLCMLVEGAVADWSAVYLRSTLNQEASVAAVGYSAFALSMAACRIVGDVSVRRFGSSKVVALGGLIAVAGLALVLSLPTVLTACVGFAMVGIGLANIVPVIFSAAGRSTDTPAIGVSMAATAGYAGFLIGPPLIGLGAGWLGLRLALCVLVLAAAIVCLLGGRAVRGVRLA